MAFEKWKINVQATPFPYSTILKTFANWFVQTNKNYRNTMKYRHILKLTLMFTEIESIENIMAISMRRPTMFTFIQKQQQQQQKNINYWFQSGTNICAVSYSFTLVI